MKQTFSLLSVIVLLATSISFTSAGELRRTSTRTMGGPVYYGGSGCDSCAAPSCGIASCDGGCGTCDPCCPRLIPAIVRGLDCLLEGIFCNPCNVPTCRPRTCGSTCCSDAWVGYGGGCGCGGGGSGGVHMENWSPTNEGNPFVDDELKLPPQPPKEARVYRSQQAPVIRRATVPANRVAKPAKIAKIGQPTPAVRPVEAPKQANVVNMKRVVKPIAHESETTRSIPKNPLRDE